MYVRPFRRVVTVLRVAPQLRPTYVSPRIITLERLAEQYQAKYVTPFASVSVPLTRHACALGEEIRATRDE
jgi:hypothetical protein